MDERQIVENIKRMRIGKKMSLVDGRERSRGHRDKGIFAPKGSKDAEILEDLQPTENEIVLPKTASGVFNSTAIDQILRNLRIENLVITGVVTNNCVENAVRDACDRGYAVVLVEDGCAAVSEELHSASLRAMRDHFEKIKTTAEVLKLLKTIR
jgi:biuret amidohydrolase